MVSPSASVNMAERNSFPDPFWEGKSGFTTSVGISHGVSGAMNRGDAMELPPCALKPNHGDGRAKPCTTEHAAADTKRGRISLMTRERLLTVVV